jgi:hypothetical protein
MFGSFRPTVEAPPTRVPLRLAGSDRLAFVLQEYAAVWAEIHTSLASQVSVLAFGAAAVGLLMSAAAQLWMTASLVAGLLLLLATPAVCFLALAIYLGEQVRLMRAGFFLYRLEETANQSAGQPQSAVPADDGRSGQVLTWEHWASIHVRTGDVDRQNRSVIILVFALLGAGSAAAGFFRMHTDAQLDEIWTVLVSFGCGALALLSTRWLAQLASYADKYRKKYAASGDSAASSSSGDSGGR